MTKVLIIGGHGLGDCLLALQCAKVVESRGIKPTVYISARKEIFDALYDVFYKTPMTRIDESYSENNLVLRSVSKMKELSEGFDEVYYVIPDLLFNNKYAFNFDKYCTNPQSIRSLRLLDSYVPKKNIVYLGLMTTTRGYMYYNPVGLAINLAKELANYEIYFPVVDKWASQDIEKVEIPKDIPSNLIIDKNPIFSESLLMLMQSTYFIGTDNGPSHIAYHAGINRILLDPQYGRLPWIARWREDYSESVPISTSIGIITHIAKCNLKVIQSTLIPRMECANISLYDWERQLLLKER